jgi:ribosome-associated heat shock protein Hsp15
LWYARFFKSRSLAAKNCAGNKVRINRRIASKASANVRIGDVLTFPQGRDIRVIRIADLGARRGPAIEAQVLYEDLTPAETQGEKQDQKAKTAAAREPGSGRPTKRERRQTDRLRGGFIDD